MEVSELLKLVMLLLIMMMMMMMVWKLWRQGRELGLVRDPLHLDIVVEADALKTF